jgi:hypothetical protein
MNAPVDDKKTKAKSVPLKAEIAVLKSKLPATVKRSYGDFDDFAALTERLANKIKSFEEQMLQHNLKLDRAIGRTMMSTRR